MAVKCDEYNGVCVLAIEGDLNEDAGLHVKRFAEQRITERSVFDFVVDMENSRFLNSRGLETLLWLKRRCAENHGSVKLVGLDDNCRKIFEVTRLSHRFECHADLPSALRMR